jgi:RNA polymerase sigma-70 factor (ECF subfamily)
VLCDVLDWRASEVARLLEITISAVSSALHRARTTLSKHYLIRNTAVPALSANSRSLLERYVRAWEEADIAGLVSLLKEDAAYAMPPSSAWFKGKEAIAAFFGSHIFAGGVHFRLRPIEVSGGPGFAAYLYDPATKQFQAHAIHVLTLGNDQLAAFTTFLNPALFSHFGLPLMLAHTT